MQSLALACSLCNESSVQRAGDKYTKIGEATETALVVLVEKMNVFGLPVNTFTDDERAMACNTDIRRRFSRAPGTGFCLEFDRDRKSMSVYVQGDGSSKLYCKGASEKVLERCTTVMLNNGSVVPLTEQLRVAILAKVTQYGTGQDTLRCLALASIEAPEAYNKLFPKVQAADPKSFVQFEQGMTFLGVVGMLDPPRTEVADSLALCGDAGIRVIVITGDNKDTAVAICRRIGVFTPTEDVDGLAYTGAEFDALPVSDQQAAVHRARLFARVEPAHKSKIVEYLQKDNEIVAMVRIVCVCARARY